METNAVNSTPGEPDQHSAQKLQVLFVATDPYNHLYDLQGEVNFSVTSTSDAVNKISGNQTVCDAIVVDATIDSASIKILRKATSEKNLPLIFYTSFFDQVIKDRALKLKADDYMSGSMRYSFGSKIKLLKQMRKFKVQWLEQEHKCQGKKHRLSTSWLFLRKRILDIIISSIALILFSPLLLVLSVVQEIELMEETMLSDLKNKQLLARIFCWYHFLVLILYSPIFMIIKLPLKIMEGKLLSNVVESSSTRLDKLLIKRTLDRTARLFGVLKGDISLFSSKSIPSLL